MLSDGSRCRTLTHRDQNPPPPHQLPRPRSIEWIMERYAVTTHRESGIVNDPNLWCDEHNQPRYIIDLLKRIVGLSLETMKIVKSLPKLGL